MADSFGAEWLEGQEAQTRSRFRWGLVLSLVLHAGVVGVLFYSPEPEPMRMPEVISVRMVALPGAPPAPPRAVPKAAAPQPAPDPVPARAPAPAQKKVLLPKRPAPVSKKRKPKPKPEPMEYDDALAALRDELGEPEPPAPAPEAEVEDPDARQTPSGATGAGTPVPPEVAEWLLATRRHVRERWVVPPDFVEKGLVTGLLVTLTSTGEVVGPPEVVRTSGDPYFDDNTVRAIMRATPLPPPPEAGEWNFSFSADEGL